MSTRSIFAAALAQVEENTVTLDSKNLKEFAKSRTSHSIALAELQETTLDQNVSSHNSNPEKEKGTGKR